MNKVKPWNDKEKTALHLTAKLAFDQHGHDEEADFITKYNCSACRLVGYQPFDTGNFDSPNVAGWERMYVEAQRALPEKWKNAFEKSLFDTSNVLYLSALRRSIATFGYPKFKKE